MRVVYEPANIIDAHLVKGVLEQAGIPVYLRGEFLIGGIGELPVSGMLALCVPEICEIEARGILEELERDRASMPDVQVDGDDDWIGVQA
jgi:hypothetical protein